MYIKKVLYLCSVELLKQKVMTAVDFIFEYSFSIVCLFALPIVLYKAYKTIMNYDAEEFRKNMQK